MKATDLRPGMAVKLDGKLYVISKFEHRTPGNLRAFIQVKLKDVSSGANIERRLNSGDDVDVTTLDRRTMEYLYSDNTGHTFMDQESYDQLTLDDEFCKDEMLYLRANTSTIMLIHEGRPVLIELPQVVELQVTETSPGIKGATATNQLKEATLETGLKTRVPPFIEVGETIKVSTTDGSYQSRA
ncbi:MAG: elongation factor P [Phycisphaerales bacterium]|nr:MAG: elongation factor P [Phycisphaerales bacterium]